MRPRHHHLGSAAAVLVASIGSVTCATRGVQSFYVSGAIDGGTRIVEALQQGPDTRVRVIEVVQANEFCPGMVVRAYDQVVEGTSPKAIAGAPLCSISEWAHGRALSESRHDGVATIDWFGWTGSLVAACEGRERRFVFEQRPGYVIDEDALGRWDHDVLDSWKLTQRAMEPKALHSTGLVPGDRPPVEEQERLGTSLVPDLVNGRYETAFRNACWDGARNRTVPCVPNYFASLLEGYDGPPAVRGPLPIEPEGLGAIRFTRYVAPVFSPIALTARVYGDVRLRLEVERSSGAVVTAGVLDVPPLPLHTSAAVAAALQWRFDPTTMSSDVVDVTLRFRLRCPPP